MHAKIWIRNSILKDVHLKRRFKYKTKLKIKLKRQAIKPHGGFPLMYQRDATS